MAHWSSASANSQPFDHGVAALPDVRFDKRCPHFNARDLSWVDLSISQLEAELGPIAQLLGEVIPK